MEKIINTYYPITQCHLEIVLQSSCLQTLSSVIYIMCLYFQWNHTIHTILQNATSKLCLINIECKKKKKIIYNTQSSWKENKMNT